MLSELDAASQSFDASKATYGSADLIYGGNTTQWKKFAWSLMMRLGMRLTKVDLTTAQTWVTKAITGGVITADADIAKMPYGASGQKINQNPLALDLWNNDYIVKMEIRIRKAAIPGRMDRFPQAYNDPRLPVISVVWVSGQTDTVAAHQKGMSPDLVNTKPANFITYSEPNPATLLLLGSPKLIFTVAESDFLLAEAALRGWYSGATASALYQGGIQAAMRQWAINRR